MPVYNKGNLPFDWKSNPNKWFTNRCVSSDGIQDWYNGSRYVYSWLKDGRFSTDGPYISGHEQTDWKEGTRNHE